MTGLLENLLNLGYLGVFVFSLALNLVPFLSPSNIIISGAVGSLFPSFNPFLVGFLVALGASIAKTVHFAASFFAGSYLKSRWHAKIGDYRHKSAYYRLGMIAAFAAAVSPIPDDPIVIPLGLMRYSPVKFFIAYFLGKMIVTVTGAYFGQAFSIALEEHLGQTATIVVSAILTVLIAIVLIKKEAILGKLSGRWPFLDRLHLSV